MFAICLFLIFLCFEYIHLRYCFLEYLLLEGNSTNPIFRRLFLVCTSPTLSNTFANGDALPPLHHLLVEIRFFCTSCDEFAICFLNDDNNDDDDDDENASLKIAMSAKLKIYLK